VSELTAKAPAPMLIAALFTIAKLKKMWYICNMDYSVIRNNEIRAGSKEE
jgi:hypothetical protein